MSQKTASLDYSWIVTTVQDSVGGIWTLIKAFASLVLIPSIALNYQLNQGNICPPQFPALERTFPRYRWEF